MSGQLGILFLHHALDDATRINLSSIRKLNPSATIVTVSAGKKFPRGYTLDATPRLKKIHSANPARSSDWLVCSWFQQRREHCDKWWIVEWDTFCAVPAAEYYRPVWNFPFVASSVRLPHREPEWAWFQDAKNLPEKYKPFALGAVPFLYLVSNHALEKICAALVAQPFTAGNGELRFATVANWCGFAPCGFSPPNDRITWMNCNTAAPSAAIVHPMKHAARKIS